MNPIKAVIFDLEGVLVRWQGEHPHVLLARKLNVDLQTLRTVLNRYILRLDAGEISVEEMYTCVYKDLGITGNNVNIFDEGYLPLLSVDREMETFVRSLRPRFRTALLSNFSLRLRGLLETRWMLADAFDKIVISAEVKMIKPQPEIFELTLARLGCTAGEAVFIDDREENVFGAEAVGIRSVLYDNTSSTIAEVKSLIGLS